MKQPLKVLVLIALCCLFSTSAVATSENGKIIDIFGEGIVTVQLAKQHSFSVGDILELSYLAGAVPMQIGRYKVTTAAGKIFLAKPLALNMPPDNGMNVEISLVKDAGGLSASWTEKKAQSKTESQNKIAETQPTQITGEVIEVKGDDIIISIKDTGTPKIGWVVDLLYTTRQGQELPVGTWKVETITGKTVAATKLKGIGDARKGLKAVLYQKKPTPVVQKNTPTAIKQAAIKPTTRLNSPQAQNRPQAVPQPVRVRGQAATAPGKQKISSQPSPASPALPPGVSRSAAKKSQKRSGGSLSNNPEVIRLTEMLTSNNMKSKRSAAKTIARNSYEDGQIYGTVQEQLLGNYKTATDRLGSDTMAWLCKALASSKDEKYIATLREVVDNTRNRKLKKYAAKSLRQLR